MDSTVHLTTGLELSKYVYAIHKNKNNYKPDDKIAANNEKNNEKTEDIKGLLDNPYIFYSMYN